MKKIYEKFIDECESMMSHAEHRKKIASMDYHTSEENHQDGRWHCAYDLIEWCKNEMEKLNVQQD